MNTSNRVRVAIFAFVIALSRDRAACQPQWLTKASGCELNTGTLPDSSTKLIVVCLPRLNADNVTPLHNCPVLATFQCNDWRHTGPTVSHSPKFRMYKTTVIIPQCSLKNDFITNFPSLISSLRGLISLAHSDNASLSTKYDVSPIWNITLQHHNITKFEFKT